MISVFKDCSVNFLLFDFVGALDLPGHVILCEVY